MRTINSRQKGARGERQWRDELRANGFAARRGQQFSGSAESPDVVCPALPWIHWEVKCVESLNIEAAMEQARRDAGGEFKSQIGNFKNQGGRIPIVAHRRNCSPWLITMEADWLFDAATGFLGGNCHFCERVGRRLNLRDTVEAATREAGERVAFVVHGRKGTRLVTMAAETFFKLLRGGIRGVSCLRVPSGENATDFKSQISDFKTEPRATTGGE